MTNLTPKNWVAERAKCNMGKLWVNVQRLVKSDIEAMHDLEEHPGHFNYTRRQRTITVEHTAILAPETLTLAYVSETATVYVARNGEEVFRISTRWNAENSACEVVVHASGNPLTFPHDELWKAMQHILEPFFFPPESAGVST